jgi:hypothetical protein
MSAKHTATLSLLVILASSSLARGVVVTTIDELEQAVAAKASLIELNAPEFVLRNNLIINYDCTIRPYGARSGLGGVAIDGNNLYHVAFTNADFVVGQDDNDNPLTFTRGASSNVCVYSTAAETEITFYFTRFMNSFTGNGLSTLSGAYDLTAELYGCEASYNDYDGFNMHNANSSLSPHVMTLTNCTAVGNDPNRHDGAAGDGATGHDANQTLYINGGSYHDNGKSGIAMVGGSTCIIDEGAIFYDNNAVTSRLADLYVEDNSQVEVKEIASQECTLRARDVSEVILCGYGFAYDPNGGKYGVGLLNWSSPGATSETISLATQDTYSRIVFENVSAPGDTDHDDDVDLVDLGNLAAGYGLSSGATWEQGDFDGDGDVDLVDLGTLAGNYGYGVPAPLNFAADAAKLGLSDAKDAAADESSKESNTQNLSPVPGASCIPTAIVLMTCLAGAFFWLGSYPGRKL